MPHHQLSHPVTRPPPVRTNLPLDRPGVRVSSGSSCTSSTLEPSHVLVAMGALTHGNVRVSLSRDTTKEAVDRFLAVLPGTIADLRSGP